MNVVLSHMSHCLTATLKSNVSVMCNVMMFTLHYKPKFIDPNCFRKSLDFSFVLVRFQADMNNYHWYQMLHCRLYGKRELTVSAES